VTERAQPRRHDVGAQLGEMRPRDGRMRPRVTRRASARLPLVLPG
jgi:hypothetical protein